MQLLPSFAVLVLSVALLGCSPKEVAVKSDPPRPVRTMVVQPQSTAIALQLPGEVRPRIETRLGFRVGGKLSQRSVSVGDRVSPGQLLARLDPIDLAPALTAQQAQVVAARTDRDLAVVELERLRDLRKQNYISQASLDRQQATHDAAVARLNAAEAQMLQARNAIDFQTLRADVAGVVTAVEAEVGQVVSPGQAVIRVAHTGEREIAFNIPETSLAAAREARDWSVLVPAIGNRKLAGRVREISPISDPASRTYAARITLSGDLDGVALGMTTVVLALRASEPVFVLPLSALQSRDGQARVWRVDAATGTVDAVPVQTGGLLDDAVRITGGLDPGDRIVTAGASLLIPKQPVRVLDDAPAAPTATLPLAPATTGPATSPKPGAAPPPIVRGDAPAVLPAQAVRPAAQSTAGAPR